MIVLLDSKSMGTATLVPLYVTWRPPATVVEAGDRNRTVLSGLSDRLSRNSDVMLLTTKYDSGRDFLVPRFRISELILGTD
jgi:hypothetical protein